VIPGNGDVNPPNSFGVRPKKGKKFMNVCPKVDSSAWNPLFSAILTISDFYRSRIHERTISLRFLGIILRVLRHITNQFQTTVAQGGVGDKSVSRVAVNCKEENS
jgi:hypothetical protein